MTVPAPTPLPDNQESFGTSKDVRTLVDFAAHAGRSGRVSFYVHVNKVGAANGVNLYASGTSSAQPVYDAWVKSYLFTRDDVRYYQLSTAHLAASLFLCQLTSMAGFFRSVD